MSQLVAFALGADYEGTVEVDYGDGPEEVPKFSGGLLYVGDGDFEVSEELEKGDGTIVVREQDSVLVELLDAYPALKRVPVPEKPAAVVSPYERRTVEDLRHVKSLRDLEGGAASREDLTRHLEAHDAALAAGQPGLAEAVRAGDEDAIATALGEKSDGLDGMTKADLTALAEKHKVEIPASPTNPQIIEALRARGVRKGD